MSRPKSSEDAEPALLTSANPSPMKFPKKGESTVEKVQERGVVKNLEGLERLAEDSATSLRLHC